ncbi:hypothetical protein I3760_04G170000 [Carya illinoinensis]|nr:hypothetical protein I3760_04G170000 [Carya illinoinensis]
MPALTLLRFGLMNAFLILFWFGSSSWLGIFSPPAPFNEKVFCMDYFECFFVILPDPIIFTSFGRMSMALPLLLSSSFSHHVAAEMDDSS